MTPSFNSPFLKKNNVLFLAALFMLNILAAQSLSSLKVSESKKYRDMVGADIIHSTHSTEDGHIGLIRDQSSSGYGKKRKLVVNIYDQNLKKVFEKVVERYKKEEYIGEVAYGDKIKFFTVYASKKTKRTIYCHVLDIKNRSYVKQELFEIQTEKISTALGKNQHETQCAISDNGKYFVIQSDNIKKNTNSYSIRVYDSNSIALLYKKDYQKNIDQFFEPKDLAIDNNGTVYSLGKLFKQGRTQKNKGKANYEFSLNKINQNDAVALPIAVEEEHIKSLSISLSDDHLKLVGFYSNKNVHRIKGGCNFHIDLNTFTLSNKKINELPSKVYEDLYGYRTDENSNKRELKNFYIDHVINDKAGNLYIIAEEFYETVSVGDYGPNMKFGMAQVVSHYDDILILKFNPKGDLEWGRSLFKRDIEQSYNVFIKDERLHVILNSGRVLTEETSGRIKASVGLFESTALYDIAFTQHGELSYNKIQDNKKKIFYQPNYGYYYNTKFIMPSKDKYFLQFMSLE